MTLPDGQQRGAERDELVELIGALPGVADRLAAEHRPDRTGHCGGCYSSAHVPPVWPCILAILAHAVLVQPQRPSTPRTSSQC